MSPNVAIVIPFYRDTVSVYEKIALQQCEHILKAYPKIAVKPDHLVLPGTASEVSFANTVSFDDHYFESIAGYNHLMLSAEFYKAFLDYDYILIYQLDCFVFRDELTHWCSHDLDYIGAPWIRKKPAGNVLKSVLLKTQQSISTGLNLRKNGAPNKYQFENKVGNGGLSLRRVKTFYELCLSMSARIEYYLSQSAHQYNEDAFWSLEVKRQGYKINIPDWKTALKFAFETYPESAYQLNNKQLPFGCHDWDRYLDFWRPVFKDYNVEV